MSEKVNPTRIGLFVVVALALAIAAVFIVGGGKLFEKHYPCVLYFDGSLNGLRTGAPVKFKGVEVGQVKSIRLPVFAGGNDPPVEVVIELDASQLDPSAPPQMLAERAITRGLRAQLEADSFVTGVLFVSLVFAPDSELHLRGLRNDLPELPTIPTAMQRLQDAAAQLISQLERIDLATVVRDVGAIVSTMRGLVESEGVQATLEDVRGLTHELRVAATDLDSQLKTTVDSVKTISQRVDSVGAQMESGLVEAKQALTSARKFIDDIDERGAPLLDSVRTSVESLNRVTASLETGLARAIGMLDPDAPLAVQLHNALVELQGTARATRELVEFLERNPAALVRGKYPGQD